MLQNDPVRNLQYDSEIRVAQQPNSPRVDPIVYNGPVSITSQPSSPRIALPIATVDEGVSGRSGTFIPRNGFEFLMDLPSVHIEQTYELNESLTAICSENRFVIRSPLGDTIYAATESSTERQRMLWGASRAFQMHLLDKTHQEAMVLRKKWAMGAFCCSPQTLEVWKAPGIFLGRIVQSPTFMQPEFYIEDGNTGEPLFCIEGPSNAGCCCFCLPKESYFKLHSGGTLRASIDHKWLPSKSMFTTNIYFSDKTLKANERALILASAFLLEYMYFQKRF